MADRVTICSCDLHRPNCEPPSELCCRWCSEAGHPLHPPGVSCTWADDRDVAFGQALARLAGRPPVEVSGRWLVHRRRRRPADAIDWLIYLSGRLACQLLRRHNVSCRGRLDHVRPDGTVVE